MCLPGNDATARLCRAVDAGSRDSLRERRHDHVAEELEVAVQIRVRPLLPETGCEISSSVVASMTSVNVTTPASPIARRPRDHLGNYDGVGALVSHGLGCDDVDGELDPLKLCVVSD